MTDEKDLAATPTGTPLLGTPISGVICETEEKWSLLKFCKGLIFNKFFIAWVSSFILVGRVLLVAGQSDTVKLVLIITWGAISVIWILSEAWKKFIENGELKVAATVGASATVKAEGALDKIAEAVKK